MRPHFLHNDANYGVNFLNTTTYVLLLSVDCAWFVSRLDSSIPSVPERTQKPLEN